MSLADLIRGNSGRGRFATATPATLATLKRPIPPTVATVATVAVANPRKPIPDPIPAPRHGARDWLATLARHLNTTPRELLAAGVILPEEVPEYLDRDPQAMAEALSQAHPDRFQVLSASDDDRRHCRTCTNLVGRRCIARNLLVIDDISWRCLDYRPTPDDPDQRSGAERFAWIAEDTEGTP